MKKSATLVATVGIASIALATFLLLPQSSKGSPLKGRPLLNHMSEMFEFPILRDNYLVVERPLNAMLQPNRVAAGEKRHRWSDEVVVFDLITREGKEQLSSIRLTELPKSPAGRRPTSRIKTKSEAQQVGEKFASRISLSPHFNTIGRNWKVAHVSWREVPRAKLPTEVESGITLYIRLEDYAERLIATGVGPQFAIALDGETGKPYSVRYTDVEFVNSEVTLSEGECRQIAQQFCDANQADIGSESATLLAGQAAWVLPKGFYKNVEGGQFKAVKGFLFRSSDGRFEVTVDGRSGDITKDSASIYLKAARSEP